MTNLFKSINTDGGAGGGGGDQNHPTSTASEVDHRAPTAIVIGTGFGGLAAAIRLSVKGYRVQMLEKLDAPGGRAYVHKQDGFTFDAGPTIITLPHLIAELFTLCGHEMKDHVDLRLMSPFYRIRFDDGTHFDYSNNDEQMLEQIAKFSPEDIQGFKNLMVASEKCFVYSLIHSLERRWGVHSAMGGTGAIVRELVKLLDERQVPIRYNAPVTRIRVEGGRAQGVELANGEYLPADIVVSNGDAAWTYRNLIEPQHRKHWTDKRIAKGKYSSGLFVWYFGTNRKYEDVPHHMMVLGPRYKGLLQDIFKNHKLSKDFSLYLYRPTATDPSLAPEGCDSFYALSVVPNLSSETDWPAITEQYRDAIATVLQESVLPDLKQHVVSSKVTTPQDFQDRLWSYKGAGFGLEPILVQSAWFRPHNRSEDIDGLFMVGASSQPGAGVPSVLMSAKMLETVVPDVKSFA